MSSHVGTIVVGGFPPKTEAIVGEGLGGQHSSTVVDPNFPFMQGKPRCVSIILTHRVLYNLCLQIYREFTYMI
jgi:hypothetical protein